MADFSWPTMTNTNESSLDPYTSPATFSYITDWVELIGAFSGGTCGTGIPGFTVGDPWGGELEADVPDINSDPWLGPWVYMWVLVQVTAVYSVSWSCACFSGCEIDGETLETKCTNSSSGTLPCVLASEHVPPPSFIGGTPPTGSVPADVGPIASTYSRFEFYQTPTNPLPSFQVQISNQGHWIHSQINFWAYVVYDTSTPPTVPDIPPPPVDWPAPPHPTAPPCGLFTPS
jgi:hypothetical protein